jgi:hypothetical protein
MLNVLLLSLTAHQACNTAEELAIDTAKFASSHNGHNGLEDNVRYGAPLTLLPQDKGNESPACLDGSKYGM